MYLYSKTLSELSEHLQLFNSASSKPSALLLIADDGHPQADDLAPLLSSVTKPIIGGLFPELIVNGQRTSQGMLLLLLDFELHTALLPLEESTENLRQKIAENFSATKRDSRSVFVFTDALGTHKDVLIEELYDFFGPGVGFLGGGCGSLTFQAMPCVVHNLGLVSGCAVVASTPRAFSIGVAHGWQPITSPIKVSEAVSNQVISLDWMPAFEKYRSIIEQHSGKTIREDNFFEIAKSYPLGLLKVDGEMVIRDPFKTTDSILHLVDEVREGEYVCIMHGDQDSLLRGAHTARISIEEKNEQPLQESDDLFCVDCISRVLYMQENFSEELAIIKGKQQLHGALTIGEIANAGRSYLEIFNKTIVLAKW